MLKKLPLPAAGLMLGCAALGNLLQSYSENIRLVFGAISAIICILLVLKFIIYPGTFKEDMKNPITASVSGTFSMGLMLLAGYLKPYVGNGAVYVWYFAILLHAVLIIYFTIKFIFKLDIKKVFTSYFIVYVGIVVASVSAPAFGKTSLGTGLFWFGFITLVLLLVLISYRYIKYKEIPEPAKPLFCIYTAPVSLCLAGYIQSVDVKSKSFIIGMAIVATIIYVMVLVSLPKLLKLKFYPSYAAFTFPMVISAIAMKNTMACLTKMESPVPALKYIVLVETIIATVLVVYTLIRYIMFICAGNSGAQQKTVAK